MQILSSTTVVMVGTNSIGFPFPAVPLGVGAQMNYLACINAGGSDLYVALSNFPGGNASSTNGTLVAAPATVVIPFTNTPVNSLGVGPVVMIPVQPGNAYFSACSVPNNVIVADTTATAGSGAMSLTVTSATGIAVGQSVQGPGIASGATVSSVSGVTIGISIATTSALSGTEVQFTAPPSPMPPGVLICALGI